MTRITATRFIPGPDEPGRVPLLMAAEGEAFRFTRGVHEGKTLQTVPKSYLRLLMNNRNLDWHDDKLVSTEYWTRHFGRPMTHSQVLDLVEADLKAILVKSGIIKESIVKEGVAGEPASDKDKETSLSQNASLWDVALREMGDLLPVLPQDDSFPALGERNT